MSPPNMEKAEPVGGPANDSNDLLITEIVTDSSAGQPVVAGHAALLLRRKLTAAVWPGSPTVKRVIIRAVPSAHRETKPTDDGAMIIYGSRVDSMVVALKSAGVDVRELGGEHR